MKSLALALALMMPCGLAAAVATCEEEGSQMDINRCAQDEYKASEATLADELRQLEVLLAQQPRELQLLRRSQVTWLDYVNAQLALRFPSADGTDPVRYFGTMYWSEYYGARSSYLLTRIDELRQIRRMMPQWLEMRDVADEVQQKGAGNE